MLDGDACVDGLAARYKAVANDGSASADAKKAALLFTDAEGHLQSGKLSEALKAADDAIAAYRKLGDANGLADSLRIALGVRRQRKELQEACLSARSELSSFEASGEKRAQACMMLTLAEIDYEEAGIQTSEETFQMLSKAIELFKSSNDTKMQAAALLSISNAHLVKGSQGGGKPDYDKAHNFAQQAFSLLENSQDKTGQGKASHALALACVYRGDITSGISHAESALQVWRQLKNRRLEAFEQHCLAMWYSANKALDQSIAASEAAQALFKEIRQESGSDSGYSSAAIAHKVQALLEKGETSAALEAAKSALEAAKEADDRIAEANALQMMCSCEQFANNNKEAVAHANEALNALNKLPERSTRSRLWEASILQKMASLHLLESDHGEAAEAASKAVDLCKEAKDARGEAKAVCFLSDIRISAGLYEEALDLAEQARDIFSDLGDIHGEATACLTIAAVRTAKGEGRKATAAAKTAWELFHEIGDERGEADALLTLGRHAFERYDFDAAARASQKGRMIAEVIREPAAEFAHVLASAQATYCNAVYNVGQAAGLKKPTSEWDEALKLAQEARDKAMTIEGEDRGQLVLSALQVLAQVLTGRKEYPEAASCLGEAFQICEDKGFVNQQAQLRMVLAQLHHAEKQKAEAKVAAQTAIDLFTSCEDSFGQEMAQDLLDEVMGRRKKAADSSSSSGSSSSGSSESESEEEEEEEEEEVADGGEQGVAVFSGPALPDIADNIKAAALDLIGSDDLESDTPLMDAGLDSLAAVEFGGILQKQFQGVQMPGTLMFDFPNVKSISDFIHTEMQSIDSYWTKPAATGGQPKKVKVPKEKKKKKKKKRKESSSSEEEEEEEEVQEEAASDAVAVFSGPAAADIVETIKGAALDLIGSDDLESETPLMDAGLDSLAAVEFGGILQKQFQGVQMPGTLMFDFPNVKTIGDFIHTEMQSIDAYWTKPAAAATVKRVKVVKEKKKKKKKKKRKDSSSEEEEEEEIVEEAATDAVAVFSGPAAADIVETIKGAALDLIGSDDLESETPLMDAGLDSLAAVEFGGILQKQFQGVQMPGTLMFDFPNVKSIGDFIHTEMQSIDAYWTKPAATQVKVTKVRKEKEKKKKKKKKKKSKRDDDDDEDEREDAQQAAQPETKVKVYTGPPLEEVMDTVKGAAIDLIGADELENDTPLMDAGLDSLAAVEYGGILSKAFQGVQMPGTLMFDFPNVKGISDFIYGEIRQNQGFDPNG